MSMSEIGLTKHNPDNPNLAVIIDRCGANAVKKGFDVKDILAQVLLFISEVAEALELIVPRDPARGPHPLSTFYKSARKLGSSLEAARKNMKISDWRCVFIDASDDVLDAFLEELADIVIRVFSFVGANGWTDRFVKIMLRKMDTNEGRPHMHGKGF